MSVRMLVTIGAAVIATAGASRLVAARASGEGTTPAAMQAEIEALKPKKLAWREIAWRNCPLEALKEAREKRKPVIAWVFLGNPADERC
jgi:hypothetical protein